MNYNDINIGNLDSICMSCGKAKLGTLIDSLYKTLTDGDKYEGNSLTQDNIAMLNNMCPVASNVQLGTIINNIIEASKNSEAVEDITKEEISAINNTCPGFSKCQLGTILSECIKKINGAVPVVSSDAEIIAYTIPGQTGNSVISAEGHTIAVEVPSNTEVTNLVATFTLSEGATSSVKGVTQTSGETENDFTSPVVYTVTAEDKTTIQEWTVTVTKAGE